MKAARGIAGSIAPEQQGCFLCRGESDTAWFVEMNNTGGPVDVWAVAGVDEESLLESPEGYSYTPDPIPPERLTLIRRDIEPTDKASTDSEGGLSDSINVVFRPAYKPRQS